MHKLMKYVIANTAIVMHAVCSDQQNGVSIPIAVGMSVAVMLVFSMGAFILGMIAGTYRTKSRAQQATPTQSPPVPTSHSQDRTNPEGGGGGGGGGKCTRRLS